MKMNKKGFTLIELLAVIVILAIIALITVPVVIKIIDNAKKGAAEDSTYGVLKSAQYYWALNNDDLDAANKSVTFTCSNKGVCSGTVKETSVGNDGTITQVDKTVTLDLEGTKPSAGTITINNGQYTIEGLKFGDYTCSKAATATKVTCQ